MKGNYLQIVRRGFPDLDWLPRILPIAWYIPRNSQAKDFHERNVEQIYLYPHLYHVF